jgi:L-glutamine-phosphate cytidylyltransferase
LTAYDQVYKTSKNQKDVPHVKAIILSAGQGSRLLPLTESNPKCLLDIGGGQSVLRYQIAALEAAGVNEVIVVTGFHAPLVNADLIHHRGSATVRTIYNPFYKVADNLGSVWLALREISENEAAFMIVNGDTMFTPTVAKQLLAEAKGAITLAVSQKPRYDADDMKVVREGARLMQVGKSLAMSEVNGESIGMMCFRSEGIGHFRRMVEETISSPEGTNVWYLSVINRLAAQIEIQTAEVPPEQWCEIDFPVDYEQACLRVKEWSAL